MPFVLRLNRILETRRYIDICIAETKLELEQFIESMKVEPYFDSSYKTDFKPITKHFARGSILEWFLPPTDLKKCFYEIIPFEDHIERLRGEYEAYQKSVVPLPILKERIEMLNNQKVLSAIDQLERDGVIVTPKQLTSE